MDRLKLQRAVLEPFLPWASLQIHKPLTQSEPYANLSYSVPSYKFNARIPLDEKVKNAILNLEKHNRRVRCVSAAGFQAPSHFTAHT